MPAKYTHTLTGPQTRSEAVLADFLRMAVEHYPKCRIVVLSASYCVLRWEDIEVTLTVKQK